MKWMNAEGPQLHTKGDAIPKKRWLKNADGSLLDDLELEEAMGRQVQTVDCLIWAIGRETGGPTTSIWRQRAR